MRKQFVTIATLIASAPISSGAIAAPKPGQVIWSNVLYGMTKQQFRTLYPKAASVDLGGGCSAWIEPRYASKTIIEVRLNGAGEEARCNANVLASMLAKYGQPRTNDIKAVGLGRIVSQGELVRRRLRGITQDYDAVRFRTWFTGSTLITLEINETTGKWSALYQPAEIQEPTLTDKL